MSTLHRPIGHLLLSIAALAPGAAAQSFSFDVVAINTGGAALFGASSIAEPATLGHKSLALRARFERARPNALQHRRRRQLAE